MTIELKNGKIRDCESVKSISLNCGRPQYTLENGTKITFADGMFESYISEYESALWSAVVNKHTGALYGFVHKEAFMQDVIYVNRHLQER